MSEKALAPLAQPPVPLQDVATGWAVSSHVLAHQPARLAPNQAKHRAAVCPPKWGGMGKRCGERVTTFIWGAGSTLASELD